MPHPFAECHRIVITFVLTIALLNLGLGVALAVYLEPWDFRLASERFVGLPGQPAAQCPVPLRPPKPGEPHETPTEAWLEVLDREHQIHGPFVQAADRVLRLPVHTYREQLVEIDRQVRACAASGDVSQFETLRDQLKSANNDWLQQQSEVSGELTAYCQLPDPMSVAMKLEDVLLEQAAQIEITCRNLGLIDAESDVSAGCARMISEISKLLQLADALRDRTQEALLGIARSEGWLAKLEDSLGVDPLTGIFNRAGMENLFHAYWRDRPIHERTASYGLLDIDRFSVQLKAIGNDACDKILTRLGTLLVDLVRKDRGYDIVARVEGQQFAIFFGQTEPRDATRAIERIRQSVELSTFKVAGQAVTITLSCGVTDVRAGDEPEAIYHRLTEAVHAAQHSGRNRSFLDEGHGPRPVDAVAYDLTGQTLMLD